MPKQVYTWGKVKAGDIVSFRYKGKSDTNKLTTLLVLNLKMPYKKKDDTKTFHLIGLKLETSGVISTIRNKPKLVQLLERLGEIEIVDEESDIYRVELKGVGPRGVKKSVYNKVKKYIERHSIYRTYDYKEAKRSAVFLEPIILPKELKEVLSEIKA